MTKELFLVDTTSWIFFFWQGRDPHTLKTRKLIKNLEQKGKVVTSGVILAEFIQGLGRSKKETKARQILEKHEYLGTFKEVYILAGELARQLANKGLKIPLSDCIIAATTLSYGATLVSDDPHFKRIPGLKLKFIN